MVKTHGGHTLQPRVRHSSLPPAGSSNPRFAATATAISASTTAAATMLAPTAVQGSPTVGSSPTPASSHRPGVVAPVPRRYHTWVGPTPPSPPHPRPSWRAPPSKRARTSGPGESSSSRPLEPQSPPTQGLDGDLLLDLSPASIIRRHYSPIPRNADFSGRDVHDEVQYDLPAFAKDPELRDLMLLVQRYSLEPFMTPRRFFYPRVVIEFYHTLTCR